MIHGHEKESLHNIALEQALLGAVLLDNAAYEHAIEIVDASQFYDPLHAQIFATVGNLLAAGRHVTPITLRDAFQSWPPIDEDLTVPEYLVRLAESATSVVAARDYAKGIRDLAMRRQIIMIGEGAVRDAYALGLDADPEDIIEGIEQKLYVLTRWGQAERNIVSLSDAMGMAVDSANEAHMRGTGLAGLSTGLRSIDNLIGGLVPGELIIIAGRPSMGKTALATNISLAVSREQPVAFFSLEMSSLELGRRALAEQTGVPSYSMRTGRITQADLARMIETHLGYKGRFYIDQSGGISIAQLSVRARRMRRKHGVGLIVVDYLQLMRGTHRTNGATRVQEVTDITNGLKALAKELDVPVIALSQLSRDVEKREDKRPQLSDLRESGSIEQDADTVLFVYRHEYYVQRREPDSDDIEAHQKWQIELRACEGKAEIIAGKCRHGPTSTVLLEFDGTTTTFRDLREPEGGSLL